MIYPAIRKLMIIAACSCIVNLSLAQDPGPKNEPDPPAPTEKKETKPFRILTNGKRITIQSSKNISTIMVWTASGHRIVEQKDVEAPNYDFTVPANEKFVFIMLQIKNGKHYTEKVGVQ